MHDGLWNNHAEWMSGLYQSCEMRLQEMDYDYDHNHTDDSGHPVNEAVEGCSESNHSRSAEMMDFERSYANHFVGENGVLRKDLSKTYLIVQHALCEEKKNGEQAAVVVWNKANESTKVYKTELEI